MKFILFFLLLLVATVSASPGDESFLQGAFDEAQVLYEKELTETTEPAAKRRVLLKLTGLAQARNDVAGIAKYGNSLEKALQGQDDPQVAMRLYLIRLALATRTVDVEAGKAALVKAKPLAELLYSQGDPGGALGLAECKSYQYIADLPLSGRPTAPEYIQACQSAYQPTVEVPATAAKPLWLMDVTRTTYWTRLWVWQAWDYYLIAWRNGEQQLAGQWGETAYGIGSVAIQTLNQGFQSSGDRECLFAMAHVAFELTEAFPVAGWTASILDPFEATFAQWPESSEKDYVQSRFHRTKARAAVFNKQYDEALDHYITAMKHLKASKRAIDEVDIIVEMAYAHLIDKAETKRWNDEVPRYLGGFLSRQEAANYPFARYFVLGFLGTIKAREGNLERAEQLLRQSLQQLEEWSRDQTPRARTQKLARPEVRLFSDTLVDVLLRREKQDEAADAIGQMGALKENAGIDLSRLQAKNPQTTQKLRSLEENRQERGRLSLQLQSAQSQGDQQAVQRLSRQLADSEAEFHMTVNNIRKEDPDFERMVSVRPSSFSKLQSVLPDDVVVAAYYPSAGRVLIFAVTSEKLHVYSSDLSRKQLDGLIGKARRGLPSGQPTSKAALSELHQVLIEPLEPILEDKAVLCVVPSGMLYYLPFAALQNESGPLIDRVGLSVLTATELPDVGSFGSRSKPSKLLALANPDGTLPGATIEVEQISNLFPDHQAFYGSDATEDKLKGPEDVVHFATHGVLNPNDVNESYLLVSGGDQRLTVGEIYGLDLDKVSLVTLSACETAVGELNPGAEIATLSQAFSVAGSKSMLGSLWKVDDEATALLMSKFYGHLTSGKSKAEALRLAQAEVRSQPRYESPFYWSGFVLVGDWR